jgi:hypothetical protein
MAASHYALVSLSFSSKREVYDFYNKLEDISGELNYYLEEFTKFKYCSAPNPVSVYRLTNILEKDMMAVDALSSVYPVYLWVSSDNEKIHSDKSIFSTDAYMNVRRDLNAYLISRDTHSIEFLCFMKLK